MEVTLAPQGGCYALPAEALAPLGLAHTRRRFLSAHEALAWFLTVPWVQHSRGPSHGGES